MFQYRVFGFDLGSQIELPELGKAGQYLEGNPPQVAIRLGKVPERLPNEHRLSHWFSASGTRCLYSIPDVGRLLIEGGTSILINPAPTALVSDIRTYLLGTGIGTIMHQRGIIPLHVGVVATPVGAVAFTGPPGAGKSTIVAELNKRFGWPIVTDDLAALRMEGNVPTIEGGVRRLRLWKDALDRLGWPTEGLVRDTHRYDKFLSLRDEMFDPGVQPLVALYEIRTEHAEDATTVCSRVETFETVLNAVYRPCLVGICGTRGQLHDFAAKSSARMACWRGARPSVSHVAALVKKLH